VTNVYWHSPERGISYLGRLRAMNKIKEKTLLLLLVYAPWVNVINYRTTPVIASSLMALFIGLLAVESFVWRSKINEEYFDIIKKNPFLFLAFISLLGYSIFCQKISDFFIFFNLFLLLLLVIPLFVDIRAFCRSYFDVYLSYLIIVVSLSIIVDFILLNTGYASVQPMYNSENITYLERPFGLFGQPSVNSTLICVFYLLKRYLHDIWGLGRVRNIYFVFVVLGVMCQGSGSGFISFALLLIPVWGYRFKAFKYAFILLLLGGIYYISLTDLVEKISVSYLTFLYDFVVDIFHLYLAHISSTSALIWGEVSPTVMIPIDFGPIFYITHSGILLYVVFIVTLVYLSVKEKNYNFRYAIILLFIGGLHYPVMFYVVMHFIWLLLFFVVFRKVRLT